MEGDIDKKASRKRPDHKPARAPPQSLPCEMSRLHEACAMLPPGQASSENTS